MSLMSSSAQQQQNGPQNFSIQQNIVPQTFSIQQNGGSQTFSINNNAAEFYFNAGTQQNGNSSGRTDFSSLQTSIGANSSMQNIKSEKCPSEVYLVKEYGSNNIYPKTSDDFSSSINTAVNFYPSQQNSSATNNSVQIQIINGQPSVQANLQQLQTPNGPITVAILPDFNSLRPYFVQVQRPPGPPQPQPQPQIETVQRFSPAVQNYKPNLAPSTTTQNGKCQQNQKFLPIQPKINGGGSLTNPSKSSSPVLIQKAPPAILPQPQQFPVVRTQGNIIAQTCYSPQPTTSTQQISSSSMTIQLTAEDQHQISVLTDQLKIILSSNSPLSSENERIVEILQKKRSAILEKTFLQQQQRSFMIDQSVSSSNEQHATNVSSVSNSIPFAATTQSAQIVQINGLPYLAVAANGRTINPNAQQSFVCNDMTRSQDMQRVFTPSSTRGLQLPIRPHLISDQSERTAGPSSSSNQNLNCPVISEPNGERSSTIVNSRSDHQKQLNEKKIIENVKQKISDDQYSVTIPDCKTRFKNNSDAVDRLLPYHVYNEPNVRQDFLELVDASFKNKMNSLTNKKNDLFRKFQSVLLKESTIICPSSEFCLINELISNTEKDLLNEERKMACKSPSKNNFLALFRSERTKMHSVIFLDHFVRKLIKLKDKKENEKTPDVFHSSSDDDDSADEEIVTRLKPIKTETNIDTKEKIEEIFIRISPPPPPPAIVSPSAEVKNLSCLYRDLKKIKKKVKLLNNNSKNSCTTTTSTVVEADRHRPPLIIGDDEKRNDYFPEERLKICNEIPKLLLKINTAKRKCVVEESTPDAKRVPPLKIKLTKAPQTPQPLTRLSSLGLESSDDDETTTIIDDPLADLPLNSLSSSELKKPTIAVDVVKIYNDFDDEISTDDDVRMLNWSSMVNGERNYKLNKTTIMSSNQSHKSDWDSQTAQFIRSKLKINDCISSPDGDGDGVHTKNDSVKSLTKHFS